MRFEFATATRIIFGAGTLREIGGVAGWLGERALVVTSGAVERAEPLLKLLAEHKITYITLAVSGEPNIALVQSGVEQARAEKCDLVISMGGGSVLDAGKAIAALVTNDGDVLDYLEVIGKNEPLVNPPLPFIAVPTAAGTGAEVTRNAVLASPEHRVKVSLRSPLMLPRLALVDPELTYSLPPEITASTGMDALTQVIEPYVCNVANPITDAFCRDGIERAAHSLRRAYHDGSNADARYEMSMASLFGGLALANAKLGAVHGFAGSIGGMFSAPHGAVCGRLLPGVMETNIYTLRERPQDSDALWRYTKIAAILTGNPAATAEQGAAWVRALCEEMKLPRLTTYGITEADLPALVEKSAASSSMQGNPIKLTALELESILHDAM